MSGPLPAARSRAALGLAVAAAEGRFALQVCAECGTVQYPPRDVCGVCLADRLAWQDVGRRGTLAACTVAYVSGEPYFRERLPWRTGLVRLDCGPSVVAHLPRACSQGDRVRLELRLDPSGRGAMVAMPDQPGSSDLFGVDPRNRRVLIVDGSGPTGPALVRAFAEAGAERIFAGGAGAAGAAQTAGAEAVPLDLAQAGSAAELALRIGGLVDIVVNNAGHVRPGDADTAAMFETNVFGAMRLARAFAPLLQTRATAACVCILSVWSLAGPPGFAAYAASQAALRSLNRALREEMRPSGTRVADILTGPGVPATALAAAVIGALREGREEVVVGELAREIHAKWAADPRLLAQETI